MRQRPTRYAGTRGEKLDIDRLVGALNNLPGMVQEQVVDALREHIPDVLWCITNSGVVTAQVHHGYVP